MSGEDATRGASTAPPAAGSAATGDGDGPARLVELPLTDPVAAGLEQSMERFWRRLYPEQPPRPALDPAELVRPHGVFLVAFVGDVAAGCAGLRPLEGVAGVGEMKRVWVEPAFRRRGLSRLLVKAVEQCARELGYGRLWLDTGPLQLEAQSLYQSCGYHTIPNYGPEAGTTFKTSYERLINRDA